MKIGSVVSSPEAQGQATLGCFVRKKDGSKGLFAVVSKHAFNRPGIPVFHGGVIIGTVIAVTEDDLDAAIVKLSPIATGKLKEEEFLIRRDNKSIALEEVFDPRSYRAIRPTGGELPFRIKAMHLMVWHCGYTSAAYAENMNTDKFAYNAQFGTISIADMINRRFIFAERHNRPGDSGSAVYLDSGVLVGFNGGGAGDVLPEKEFGKDTTAGGFYRLAYDVFEALNVKLATWANREKWLPLAAPPPPEAPSEPVWMNSGAYTSTR